MSYPLVVQAVLLFVLETWVLSEAMSENKKGVHVGLLRQVMVKTAKRQRDRTWRSAKVESVLKQ